MTLFHSPRLCMCVYVCVCVCVRERMCIFNLGIFMARRDRADSKRYEVRLINAYAATSVATRPPGRALEEARTNVPKGQLV